MSQVRKPYEVEVVQADLLGALLSDVRQKVDLLVGPSIMQRTPDTIRAADELLKAAHARSRQSTQNALQIVVYVLPWLEGIRVLINFDQCSCSIHRMCLRQRRRSPKVALLPLGQVAAAAESLLIVF